MNFISIYKINRTLHGRLGIRIWSSRAESISHEWAKRTSEFAILHNEWIKIVRTHQPWSNLFILYVLRFQKNTTQKNRYEE